MESNDKLKTMNVNKEILMTIVRNSGGRLVGDQEILEISEQQLATISKELTKLFSIGSVSKSFYCNNEVIGLKKQCSKQCKECSNWIKTAFKQ